MGTVHHRTELSSFSLRNNFEKNAVNKHKHYLINLLSWLTFWFCPVGRSVLRTWRLRSFCLSDVLYKRFGEGRMYTVQCTEIDRQEDWTLTTRKDVGWPPGGIELLTGLAEVARQEDGRRLIAKGREGADAVNEIYDAFDAWKLS